MGSPKSGAPAGSGPIEEQKDRVEALLVDWYHGKGWQNPSRLHRHVFPMLNEILKKGQLKKALLSHPRCEIKEDTDSKQWEFHEIM